LTGGLAPPRRGIWLWDRVIDGRVTNLWLIPAALFRLLCASLLLSTRISRLIALKAAASLSAHGWTTPEKMAASAGDSG
jgi:hypothetical protein